MILRLSVRSSVREMGVFCGSICLATLAISSQSLWIDEAVTAWFASLRSLTQLLAAVQTTSMSEAFSPGYVIYMWLWTKALGVSELVLRYSNLPFFVTLLIASNSLPSKNFHKSSAIALITLSPLVWFYLNEARSYISLMTTSAVACVLLIKYLTIDGGKKRFFASLTVFAVATGIAMNMLMLFALPPLAILLWLFPRKQELAWHDIRRHWLTPILVSLPAIVALIAYYWISVKRGAGGIRGAPGMANVAFILYEFLGLAGVGPPRNALRANPSVEAFVGYYLPLALAVFGFSLTFALWCLYSLRKKESALLNPLFIAGTIGLGLYFGFAYVMQSRMLPRHLIFLYPYFAYGISYALAHTKFVGLGRSPLLILLPLLAVWSYSNMKIRFAAEYQKEDYRAAVELSKQYARDGVTIGWCADKYAGSYYGLTFEDQLGISNTKLLIRAVDCTGLDYLEELEQIARSYSPLLLVVGKKTDIFDPNAVVTTFLSRQGSKPLLEQKDFTFYRIEFRDGPR